MNQGWEKKKLGEVLVKTKMIDPSKRPEEEFIYLDVSSVNKETKEIESATILLGKDAPSRARKLVRANDVIFATVRPTHSRVALITEDYDGQVCSTGYFVLRGKENIDNKYLFYFLLTDEFNQQMEKLQKGASYPAVTDAEVKSIFLRYPKSLPEQQRIVSILDECFAAIAKAKANVEQNLKNAKELFESYLQGVFENKGDGWEEKKWGELCDFVRGPFGGSLKKNVFKESGYVVYEQKHAIHDHFNQLRYFVDEEKFNEMKRFEIFPGDIIMSCSGVTLGRVAVVPEGIPKGIINQALLKLTPKKNVSVHFIKYWLRSSIFQKVIFDCSGGAAIPNVPSSKILKDIKIPYLSLGEQERIVLEIETVLNQTKRLENIYQKKLSDLENLKKSILQKAFAGELTSASLTTTRNEITI